MLNVSARKRAAHKINKNKKKKKERKKTYEHVVVVAMNTT